MKITKDHIIMVLTLLIVISITIFAFAFQDGDECINSPLTYGAEKLSSEETGDLFCSCFFTNPKYQRFSFDKNNMTVGP